MQLNLTYYKLSSPVPKSFDPKPHRPIPNALQRPNYTPKGKGTGADTKILEVTLKVKEWDCDIYDYKAIDKD